VNGTTSGTAPSATHAWPFSRHYERSWIERRRGNGLIETEGRTHNEWRQMSLNRSHVEARGDNGGQWMEKSDSGGG